MGWYQEGYQYWLFVLRTIFLGGRLHTNLEDLFGHYSKLETVPGSSGHRFESWGAHTINKSQKRQFGTTHSTRGVDLKYSLIYITKSRMCKFVRFRLCKFSNHSNIKETDQNDFFGIEIDSFNFDCHSLVHCVL